VTDGQTDRRTDGR